MEHFDHPSPHFNDSKMTGFGLRAPCFGEGGQLFLFILSKIVGMRPLINLFSLSVLLPHFRTHDAP